MITQSGLIINTYQEDFTMDYDIPKIQLDILSRTLLSAMERFYAAPDNRARFEEWKQSKEGKEYLKRTN